MSRERCTGFTLYELLLAFAILGLLAAFAWSGFAQLTRAVAQRDEVAARLGEVQRTLALAVGDLIQADGRRIREGFHGAREAAMLGGGGGYALEFSRAGWRNPASAPRPPSLRVAYTLERQELVRYAWRVLDRAPNSQPVRRVLLHRVEAFEVAFLAGGAWRPDWPPADGDTASVARPRAVRLALTLADQGRIERVIELIGDVP